MWGPGKSQFVSSKFRAWVYENSEFHIFVDFKS